MIFIVPLLLLTLIRSNPIANVEIYDCARINNSIAYEDFVIVKIKALTLRGFNSFSDLKFECDEFFSVPMLQLIPNTELILDQSLNLTGLLIQSTGLTIHFAYLKGIDVNSHSTFHLNTNFILNKIFIDISYSRLTFFSDSELIDIELCFNFDASAANFLTQTTNLVLRNYNIFNAKICPYVFNNSDLNTLVVNRISSSFLNRNQLEFVDVKKEDMVSRVNSLFLRVDYDQLTLKILNKNVFRFLNTLSVSEVLYGIEPSLFRNFQYLSKISLVLYNFKQFFHATQNEWFSSLKHDAKSFDLAEYNKKNNINLLNILFKHDSETSFNTVYAYPDEDFCLFRRFPHAKIVYPILDPGEPVACTCTVLWLLQHTLTFFSLAKSGNADEFYSISYLDFIAQDLMIIPLIKCVDARTFNRSFDLCNFAERLQSCNQSKFNAGREGSSGASIFGNDIDVLYAIKWLEYVFLVVLTPILASVGFLSSLLLIIVVENLKNLKKHNIIFNNNKSNRSLFKHIKINAVFNLVLCVVMIFKLVNECLFYTSSIYCSKVSITYASQSFKVVFIEFFGNLVEMCGNLSYLGISFSRFILISNKGHGLYKRFDEIRISVYVVGLLVFGSLMSVFKLFQYKINYGYFSFGTLDFPNEIRTNEYCFENGIECAIFNVVKIANNFLNDFFFLVLILIVDLILFKNYGQYSKNRKRLIKSCKQDEGNHIKNRITKMIIINGVIYLCSHFPELLVIVLLYVFQTELNSFCSVQMTCDKMNEMARVFIFISIISQFFLNNTFNKHFNESFNDILSRFRAKPPKKASPDASVSSNFSSQN
jgi:hypothetical protein